jgi:hypothetical protein
MDGSKNIFLLRAFGDFIIAVHLASKNNTSASITLIASRHLTPLYRALSPALPPNVNILFHDFSIRNNLMGWFTDRYLLHPHSLTEIWRLRKYIRNHPIPGTYYLEHKKRSALVGLGAGYSFRHIISDENVYKAYADFFSTSLYELENIPFNRDAETREILIIPDARQAKRRIGNDIIEKIKTSYQNKETKIQVAVFRKTGDHMAADTVVYEDFAQLVHLIRNADVIIGSDSMPIHVAQMLGKPHYILYPRYVKDQFFTPFAMKHKSYFTFEDIAARKSFFPDDE